MRPERRPSAIAGHGLFATAELAPGDPVDLDPALLNHSCDPSLLWSPAAGRLVATRETVPGVELTVDYATLWPDPQLVVRCHCETYRCRQLVTGDDWRIPELRRRYAGAFAPAVQRLVDGDS